MILANPNHVKEYLGFWLLLHFPRNRSLTTQFLYAVAQFSALAHLGPSTSGARIELSLFHVTLGIVGLDRCLLQRHISMPSSPDSVAA
jgi:hypothetical protein